MNRRINHPWVTWQSLRCLGLLFGLVLSPVTANAEQLGRERSAIENLQVHGFASLAVIKTSANRFYGSSEDWSLGAVELGINASYAISPQMLAAGQLILRKAGEISDGDPSLDYALIDLKLDQTAAHRAGVRLGRLKNPIGLYNETRDVPFTRPSIFLPQAVYFDKARNLLLSIDGGMLYADLTTDHGSYATTIGIGRAVTDTNLEWVFLGADGPGDLGTDSLSWIGSFWYATPADRLRLGVSLIDTRLSYAPGIEDQFAAGHTDLAYRVFSAQYNTEYWTFSSEYARLPTRYRGYGPLMPFSDLDSEGYYLQAAYRARPDLELLLRYESAVSDRGSRSGQALSAQTLGQIPPFDFFSHAWTVGVSYMPEPYWMLRAQFTRNQGTYSLSPRENDPQDLVKDWNLFSLQFTVRF